MFEFIEPNWPAPANIKALSTTRQGGVSLPPYQGLNVADHVGDAGNAVLRNREWLRETVDLPAEPCWLKQVHGTDIVTGESRDHVPVADGSFSSVAGQVLAVMTADCLPLLICDQQGSEIAAVHAGWRGLLDGIIENAIDRFSSPSETLLVWLGPAIGPTAFEVGDEVRDLFIDRDKNSVDSFQSNRPGHWLADIYQLARIRLEGRGVRSIYGGERCTVSDPDRFYSYRRDGVTGRMASLIWICPEE